ncbi:hypothetical protein BH09PLA1_BH09PLA1_07240 [soil metagenome]
MRTDQFLPGIYDREITLAALDWRWGDNSNKDGLIFLCQLAAALPGPIVEIGTYRGRTTYNLALNSHDRVYTIDIGAPVAAEAAANKESMAYPEYSPGEVFLNARQDVRDRIELIIGDSSKIDLSHLAGKAAMVIVDAGHSYEGCLQDSRTAFKLARAGGIILWDDYGGDYWPGVKKAVDELAESRALAYLPRENFIAYRNAA